MTQIANITESRKRKYFSYKEQILIEHIFNIDKFTRRQIVTKLGRAPQTINTEIKASAVKQKHI
jgi:IS30 family transposase